MFRILDGVPGLLNVARVQRASAETTTFFADSSPCFDISVVSFAIPAQDSKSISGRPGNRLPPPAPSFRKLEINLFLFRIVPWFRESLVCRRGGLHRKERFSLFIFTHLFSFARQ